MAEFSLSKLPPIDSHHLDVVMKGFATERYCHFRSDKHGTSKGHELKSGTAYFLRVGEDLKQAGPVCAARLGRQKLHTVPDLTRFSESALKDDEEADAIKSGRNIPPPAQFNPARIEEEERAKDIEYMLLRWQILPEIAASEHLKRDPDHEVPYKRPPAIAAIFDEYQKNSGTVQLGEVRRVRELAEHLDPANSYTRLHRAYVPLAGIEACLDSRAVNSEQIAALRLWKAQLLNWHELGTEPMAKANALIRQVCPRMPTLKPDGLPEIPPQGPGFIFEDMAEDAAGRMRTHKLDTVLSGFGRYRRSHASRREPD